MIEVGRSEQMIIEMDKLASEDHTYKASKEEIEFYRGKLVDPHECGTLWFSTHKVRTRIQKCVVNNATPEASRGQKEARSIGTKPPHPRLLGTGMQAGGSLILSTRLEKWYDRW